MKRSIPDRLRAGAVGQRSLSRLARFTAHTGRGVRIADGEGREFLDAVGGYGVASLGHSHPDWVRAVVDQAQRLAVSPVDSDQGVAYVDALADALPGAMVPALFSTGAEAVENAVRLVQTATGRPGILTFAKGFHGKTSALRYTADPSTPEARSIAPGWMASVAFPECQRHSVSDYSHCDESAADLLDGVRGRSDLDQVGAVLVEPILGTAGNLMPRGRFHAELRRLCDERGWLLIYDESITGFGRTGRMFACEWFGVTPDVLVLSKGIGGGFPLSAVCASDDLWARSALSAPSGTSSSYGGNPLACAAGLATLEIIGAEGFLDRVGATAERAQTRLELLATRSDQVGYPRGLGLLLGFDLIDPQTGALAEASICAAAVRGCRELGVLAAVHVPRVRLSPPLTITPEEVDVLFDVFEEVLA